MLRQKFLYFSDQNRLIELIYILDSNNMNRRNFLYLLSFIEECFKYIKNNDYDLLLEAFYKIKTSSLQDHPLFLKYSDLIGKITLNKYKYKYVEIENMSIKPILGLRSTKYVQTKSFGELKEVMLKHNIFDLNTRINMESSDIDPLIKEVLLSFLRNYCSINVGSNNSSGYTKLFMKAYYHSLLTLSLKLFLINPFHIDIFLELLKFNHTNENKEITVTSLVIQPEALHLICEMGIIEKMISLIENDTYIDLVYSIVVIVSILVKGSCSEQLGSIQMLPLLKNAVSKILSINIDMICKKAGIMVEISSIMLSFTPANFDYSDLCALFYEFVFNHINLNVFESTLLLKNYISFCLQYERIFRGTKDTKQLDDVIMTFFQNLIEKIYDNSMQSYILQFIFNIDFNKLVSSICSVKPNLFVELLTYKFQLSNLDLSSNENLILFLLITKLTNLIFSNTSLISSKELISPLFRDIIFAIKNLNILYEGSKFDGNDTHLSILEKEVLIFIGNFARIFPTEQKYTLLNLVEFISFADFVHTCIIHFLFLHSSNLNIHTYLSTTLDNLLKNNVFNIALFLHYDSFIRNNEIIPDTEMYLVKSIIIKHNSYKLTEYLYLLDGLLYRSNGLEQQEILKMFIYYFKSLKSLLEVVEYYVVLIVAKHILGIELSFFDNICNLTTNDDTFESHYKAELSKVLSELVKVTSKHFYGKDLDKTTNFTFLFCDRLLYFLYKAYSLIYNLSSNNSIDSISYVSSALACLIKSSIGSIKISIGYSREKHPFCEIYHGIMSTLMSCNSRCLKSVYGDNFSLDFLDITYFVFRILPEEMTLDEYNFSIYLIENTLPLSSNSISNCIYDLLIFFLEYYLENERIRALLQKMYIISLDHICVLDDISKISLFLEAFIHKDAKFVIHVTKQFKIYYKSINVVSTKINISNLLFNDPSLPSDISTEEAMTKQYTRFRDELRESCLTFCSVPSLRDICYSSDK